MMDAVLTVTLNAAVDVTLTVPTLEAGQVYTVREVMKLPGGKGLNVARTLHWLGVPVQTTGLAGGPIAPLILDGLAAEGIAARFLPIAETSRTCNAVVELDRHRVTELNEPGPSISPGEGQDFLALFAELVEGARLVALSGSLPPGLPDDYYSLLLERAHGAGIPAILDTSGRALGPGMEAMPLLVKPNAKEAGTLLGREIESVDDALYAGQMLRERGPRLVAITLGARGSVLVGEGGAWWAHAEVQKPLSPVGSGDAFVGGFIAGLCAAVDGGESASIEEAAGRDDVLVRALVLGTACGAANTRRLGAGIMDEADIAELRRAVEVRQVA